MTNTSKSVALGIALALSLSGCSSIKKGAGPDQAAPQPYVQLTNQLPSGNSTADPRESAKANVKLAAAYMQAGQFRTALEVTNLAIASDPENVIAIMVKALIQGELKDLTGASESFRQALRIDPENPDLNHNYGAFLCKSGRPAEGEKFLRKTLSSANYERAANTHAALGTCLERVNDSESATREFRLALDLDPSSPLALVSLAKAQFEAGQYEGARLLMQRLARVVDSPSSLELSRKIAVKLHNSVEENAFSDALERRFPLSDEAKALHDGPN